jgi:hypothetical protein
LTAFESFARKELEDMTTAITRQHSEIHLHHFGAAVTHTGVHDTTFGGRSAQYVFNVIENITP